MAGRTMRTAIYILASIRVATGADAQTTLPRTILACDFDVRVEGTLGASTYAEPVARGRRYYALRVEDGRLRPQVFDNDARRWRERDECVVGYGDCVVSPARFRVHWVDFETYVASGETIDVHVRTRIRFDRMTGAYAMTSRYTALEARYAAKRIAERAAGKFQFMGTVPNPSQLDPERFDVVETRTGQCAPAADPLSSAKF